MISAGTGPLLDPDEPPSHQTVNAAGRSAFVLTCDHASARIPRQLDRLGLTEEDLARHIAFDLGAAEMTRQLSQCLDAWAILQNYSRLAIDCNRPLEAADSIAAVSDGTSIPGNQAITANDAVRRQTDIFHPYHLCIATELDRRQQLASPTILVAVHSFTPVMNGRARPWQAGVLYHRDPRVARILLRCLRARIGAVIGDNEPYSMNDSSDFTIPVHGERRRLPHVEIELRQDLIVTDSARAQWVERLADALRQAEIEVLSYCRA